VSRAVRDGASSASVSSARHGSRNERQRHSYRLYGNAAGFRQFMDEVPAKCNCLLVPPTGLYAAQ
jgi:hypothetical protein